MSFLRPEVAATLTRWRSVLVGAAIATLGLWLALTAYGALFLIGLGLTVAGAALAVTGIQRARFRSDTDQAGVVEVDERRVTYLGPYGGGAVSLDSLRAIAVHPHPAWLLTDDDGTRLMIPFGATGADALLDTFSQLPGLSPATLVAARRAPPEATRTLWSRGGALTSRA